jgi:hypothetical protein
MIRRLISSNGPLFAVVFLAATLLVALVAEGVLESGWSLWIARACLAIVTLVLIAEAANGVWHRRRRPESE